MVAALVALASLGSCATLFLRPFDPDGHGGVYAEWAPHRGAVEWWYVTGYLHDPAGHLYLYQFTLFHEAQLLGQGYLLDLAVTDYATGRHIFEERSSTDGKGAYFSGDTFVFDQGAERSSISLSRRGVSIVAHANRLAFELTLTPERPPVWESDHGAIGMGAENNPEEMSYYYSFTRLATAGTLSFRAAQGRWVHTTVSGSSWLDRQWGRFSHSGWVWFSLRFFDGDDVMLFAFPKTGLREGTFVPREGEPSWFKNFSYNTEGWIVRSGSRYGQRWRVSLPIKGRSYRIEALSPNDFNPNAVMAYWEGLCRIVDDRGKLVGYAVVETTAKAYPVPHGEP